MPLACIGEGCLSPAAGPVQKHDQERTKLGFDGKHLSLTNHHDAPDGSLRARIDPRGVWKKGSEHYNINNHNETTANYYLAYSVPSIVINT